MHVKNMVLANMALIAAVRAESEGFFETAACLRRIAVQALQDCEMPRNGDALGGLVHVSDQQH